MYIEKCPKNIRCDTLNCHAFATFNINTNGYKKNLCLCEKCFNELYKNIQNIKKQIKQEKGEK